MDKDIKDKLRYHILKQVADMVIFKQSFKSRLLSTTCMAGTRK